MKARAAKRNKGEALLTHVAVSIGSTMGMIAAKANAAQKAMTQSDGARSVKRQGKRLVRKSKIARSTK